MRRLTVLSIIVLAVGLGLRAASPAYAITYAAGWNLVSGPQGSTVVGATGSLYTLQPGDTDYEQFPASSALKAGWGYWAYFPTGGSLTSTAGTPTYSVTLSPGQWAMLGNPSNGGAATITGADTALTYTPTNGYQVSTNIPPGQGMWVQAQAGVTLTAPQPVAIPVPPTPTPAAQSPHAYLVGFGGSGEKFSAPFSIVSPNLFACVSVHSTSRSGTAPLLAFSIRRAATDVPIFVSQSFEIERDPPECITFTLRETGTFYVFIIATSFTTWGFVLDYQP